MKKITNAEYNELANEYGMDHMDDLFTEVAEESNGYTVKVLSIMSVGDTEQYVVSNATITEIKENRTDADLWDAYCRESVPTDYDENLLFDSKDELDAYLTDVDALGFWERKAKDEQDA